MTIIKGKPEGYHVLTPHLTCKNASSAIAFYEKAFGAEELVRLSAPNGVVAHADLKIGDSIFWVCDEMTEAGNRSPESIGGTAVALHLYVADVDAAFDRAVRAGVKTLQPPTDMFWGGRYSRVLDPFGHSWSIATMVREVPVAELHEAMKRASQSTDDPGPRAIHQEVTFKASSERVYRALTDEKEFAALTGAPTTISTEVGGAFSLFGGMIVGRNLELVRGTKVVQAWRAKHWPESVYSTVRFELIEKNGETRIVFDHVGFAADQKDHLAKGWNANYWEPLAKHLTK